MDYKQHQSYKQHIMKLESSKKRIKLINASITDKSGIYFFFRTEKGISYGYVGQAKHLLTRCAEHLIGFQHIDNSLKSHGFYDKDKNPTGYKLIFKEFPLEELDAKEQYYINYFANQGYQLRNKTVGSQGDGKTEFGDSKSNKGYRDGLKQGYENCRKEIITMFDKYLNYSAKTTGKIAERKLAEFRDFLNPIAMDRLERIEEMKERNE